MAGDGMHKAAIASRTDRYCREQLGEATILRQVVDIDFRTAAAVLAIVRAQKLAPFVDLQRLPRIKHRRRLKKPRGYRLTRVGHIDDRYAVARGIPAR